MQTVLWTIAALIAYAGGLAIIWKITPKLLTQSIGEGLFMAMAALDILGGLLAFGSVLIALSLYQSSLGIKVVCFFLTLGVFIIAIRQALFCWHARKKTGTLVTILTGSYCLFLAIAALFILYTTVFGYRSV